LLSGILVHPSGLPGFSALSPCEWAINHESKKHFSWAVLTGHVLFFRDTSLNAEEMSLIDDRQNDGIQSEIGSHWRLTPDTIMDGVSDGSLSLDNIDSKSCLRLCRTVRLVGKQRWIHSGRTRYRTDSGLQRVRRHCGCRIFTQPSENMHDEGHRRREFQQHSKGKIDIAVLHPLSRKGEVDQGEKPQRGYHAMGYRIAEPSALESV